MEYNEELKQEIHSAIEVLKQGGVILYPTDTIWGIGCDATNENAVKKIYELKHSHDKKSMTILVENIDKVSLYTDKVPSVAWELMEVTDKPLTMILPNGHNVAPNLIPEEGTIGIRVPDHNFCKRLLHAFRKPIVSTSANITGSVAPTRFEDISPKIKEGVDMVVDTLFEGEATGKASSIIQIDETAQIKIIRE